MTQCTTDAMRFTRQGRRRVEADFAGGRLVSDGGLLMLRQVDQQTQFTATLANPDVAAVLQGPRAAVGRGPGRRADGDRIPVRIDGVQDASLHGAGVGVRGIARIADAVARGHEVLGFAADEPAGVAKQLELGPPAATEHTPALGEIEEQAHVQSQPWALSPHWRFGPGPSPSTRDFRASLAVFAVWASMIRPAISASAVAEAASTFASTMP